MKCPKCSASLDVTPDKSGVLVCPSCGARLRSRPSAGSTVPAAAAAAPAPKPAEPSNPSSSASGSLDAILVELRAVRRLQEEALSLLRSRTGGTSFEALATDAAEDAQEDESPPPQPTIRARRQKTVIIIDDQDESRRAAVSALEQASVPARDFPDGMRGLEAIAAERPDVVILELAIGGKMAGKDVINMIKATMEWVDIPIVLYTRLPIESQKEARTIHGADEFVIKGAGATEALVARVIQLFRRG
jgi:CheY-like chemotaxis protein